MKLASIALLTHPVIILVPTAVALMTPGAISPILNSGHHGVSEVLYAFTSGAANNGSAFAGLTANTDFYNIAIGIVILLGRFISIIAMLAIAGSKMMLTLAQISNALYLNLILYVPIKQASNENLKSMNVRTVRYAHSVHHLPKQKKVIIEN